MSTPAATAPTPNAQSDDPRSPASDAAPAGTGEPTGPPTPTARSSASSILFLTVMLFLLTSGGGDDLLARSQYRDALRTLRFQQSNFSAWLGDRESNFTLVRSGFVCDYLTY